MWGIDIGTETCASAVYDKRPTIQKRIDAYIVCTSPCIIGTEAKEKASYHASRLWYGMKRVVENETEQVHGWSAMQALYTLFQTLLVSTPRVLVCAVPVYFTEKQCQCFKALHPLCILLPDTVAACLTYMEHRSTYMKFETILSVNIGTSVGLSVCQLTSTGGIETVKILFSWGSDSIGGWAIDHRLMEHFQATLSFPKKEKRHLVRLRQACQRLKHDLSLLQKAQVTLNVGSQEIVLELTRQQFETICKQELEACVSILPPEYKFDKVLLIGGTTRIPYLKQKFTQYPVTYSLHPEEAVAKGCAIYAHWVATSQTNRLV